ncbi:transposase [Methylobacterium nodulans]|uniref:transposase n=1 Tax=Methylobacterium nodulans TaxID=114616 RepID=UPI000161753C|nr:transposase [Methylobacterium nodulans]
MPAVLSTWMAPLAACFTRPTFATLPVLVAGAVLAPGRRTVTAALSSLGLREGVTVSTEHRVLSRRRWRAQATARGLLGLLIAAFVPSGPVVVGIDETLERRCGTKIKARS